MSSAGGDHSPVTPCAQSIMRSSAELVGAAIERVRGEAEGEIARLASLAERDRGGAMQALGTLLLRHDLPDATTEIRVTLGGGARYVAQLHILALEDLEAVVELDVADDNAFAHPLRVDKVVERLEVHAPEISGWLRKEVKLKPQRLDKEYITELTVSGAETRIALRSSMEGTGAGYDVVVRRTAPRVSLTRVGEGPELPTFDLTDDDETRMVDLEEKLVASAGALIDARKSLAQATLGGQPLDGHPGARSMVERLVGKMAPVVQEIARHSVTQTELVLKRLLDNGRREEIFLARRELEQKLEGLADGGRTILATLGLSEPTAAPVVAPTPAPVAVAAPDAGAGRGRAGASGCTRAHAAGRERPPSAGGGARGRTRGGVAATAPHLGERHPYDRLPATGPRRSPPGIHVAATAVEARARADSGGRRGRLGRGEVVTSWRERRAHEREGNARRRKGNACRRKGNACRRKGNACRRKGNARQREGNACRRKGNACPRKGNACRRKGNACRTARGTLANARGTLADAGSACRREGNACLRKGERLPGRGERLPTQGERLPTRGGNACLREGNACLLRGERLPTRGERSPTQGERLPTQGERLPTQGERSPTQGERLPTQGERLPTQGERLPTRGERLPTQGERLPTRGERYGARGERLRTRGERYGARGVRV